MNGAAIHDLFAALFEYPGDDYPARVARCAEALAEEHPDAAAALAAFSEQMAGCAVEAMQEQFIQTFDLNPSCALEVGWHLFGEQYERGEFLVKMRGLLRRFALAESRELPDHLAHALAVLGRMEAEEADEFAAACLHPAIEKMCAALAGKNYPFEPMLEALFLWLARRYPFAAETHPCEPVLRVLDSRGWR